ncbi:Hypothetical predicted protein [Xyrichtys novacula]|uniref:Uncharacterized protein n=1 Tax=Xyrichtys novacula TaxID=13765 RepID=A0AAV1FJP7_XYRNO|nr:Hypothetical predicted protein [Xyrichtys novacula]
MAPERVARGRRRGVEDSSASRRNGQRERGKERDKVSKNGEAERRGQHLGSRGTSRHPTIGSETTVSLALSA